MFLKAVETVFAMFILISIGWIMAYRNWISEETKKFLNKLIIKISVPALTIYNFFESFDREILASSGKYIMVALFSMMILYIIGNIVVRIIHIDPIRKGSFIAMSTVSNSMFFGLPVSLGLFGDISLPYVLFYYIGNTIIFWGLYSPRIMQDGEGGGSNKIDIKKIFNIPLITVFISGILLYLNYSPSSIVLRLQNI